MKSHFFVLAMCCLTAACARHYNILRTFNDEFKGSTKHILHQHIVPEESPYPVNSVNLTFERENVPNTEGGLSVYFIFTRSTTSFDVDRKGFVKIGESKFDIETKSIHSELKSAENTSTATTTDSTGTHTTTSSETVHWINDKFKVVLTAEMVDLLRQKQSLVFRFYSGPIPVTLTIKEFNMKKLQELLVAK